MNCLLERSYHVQTHMLAAVETYNLRPEPESSSLTHRNEKLNADSKATNSPCSSTICADYIELFSTNVNLKMLCILCLCIILCDTSKA